MPKKVKTDKKKFMWGGLHAFFYHPFVASFIPDLRDKTIVDCGSGKGINGYLIRATRDLTGAKMIGIDVSDNYLSVSKQHNIYDTQIKHSLPKIPLKDKSVDLLLCTEVIEHLTKTNGEKLLQEIDRVCRGRAIVTTPNMFFENTPNEEEDKHRSAWSSSDFSKRGYKVYGLGARIVVHINDPLLKIKQSLYYMLTPFSYIFPKISGYLLSVKDY